MIGLKIQNSTWEKTLLALLGSRAEVWQKKHSYIWVLTDLSGKKLKDFQMNEKASLIGLGKTNLPFTLALPFKKNELEKILAMTPTVYENKFFIWNGALRQLTHKKTQKTFLLTEKENALLTYLSHLPCHQATKEELLQNVWFYTKETDSHTVESTIATLRKKLGMHANEVIVSIKTGYQLT